MRSLVPRSFALACVLIASLAACDRRIEPFDPSEKPSPPEISKIFRPEVDPIAEAAAAARARPPSPAGGGPPITGTVELAAELAGRVPSGATLFLIARRAAAGPPLAVVRLPVPAFPFAFEIGPEDRMIPDAPFEGPITIQARIDADGNATTRGAADLSGSAPAPVDPGATGVVVVLDQVGDAAG